MKKAALLVGERLIGAVCLPRKTTLPCRRPCQRFEQVTCVGYAKREPRRTHASAAQPLRTVRHIHWTTSFVQGHTEPTRGLYAPPPDPDPRAVARGTSPARRRRNSRRTPPGRHGSPTGSGAGSQHPPPTGLPAIPQYRPLRSFCKSRCTERRGFSRFFSAPTGSKPALCALCRATAEQDPGRREPRVFTLRDSRTRPFPPAHPDTSGTPPSCTR